MSEMIAISFGILIGIVMTSVTAWLIVGVMLRKTNKLPSVESFSDELPPSRESLQAERIAELTMLTGGLAHEIKNPLSTIGLNLQLLIESVGEADLAEQEKGRIVRRLQSINAETDRLRDILEDFLSFAGQVRLDSTDVSMNQLIEQLADFYEPQAAASGVKLRHQLDPNVPTTQADPTLLKQAILNLLINATQAMVEARYDELAHGGACDLMLTTEFVSPTVAGKSSDDESLGHIVIHVIDTGPGIPEDMQKKIFQPYYSTKKGGSGLGLAVTRRIIEEHRGSLALHSVAGTGTDFSVTLPVQNTPITSNQTDATNT